MLSPIIIVIVQGLIYGYALFIVYESINNYIKEGSGITDIERENLRGMTLFNKLWWWCGHVLGIPGRYIRVSSKTHPAAFLPWGMILVGGFFLIGFNSETGISCFTASDHFQTDVQVSRTYGKLNPSTGIWTFFTNPGSPPEDEYEVFTNLNIAIRSNLMIVIDKEDGGYQELPYDIVVFGMNGWFKPISKENVYEFLVKTNKRANRLALISPYYSLTEMQKRLITLKENEEIFYAQEGSFLEEVKDLTYQYLISTEKSPRISKKGLQEYLERELSKRWILSSFSIVGKSSNFSP